MSEALPCVNHRYLFLHLPRQKQKVESQGKKKGKEETDLEPCYLSETQLCPRGLLKLLKPLKEIGQLVPFSPSSQWVEGSGEGQRSYTQHKLTASLHTACTPPAVG